MEIKFDVRINLCKSLEPIWVSMLNLWSGREAGLSSKANKKNSIFNKLNIKKKLNICKQMFLKKSIGCNMG
jgi:hypothetical protein